MTFPSPSPLADHTFLARKVGNHKSRPYKAKNGPASPFVVEPVFFS